MLKDINLAYGNSLCLCVQKQVDNTCKVMSGSVMSFFSASFLESVGDKTVTQ